MSTTNPSTTTTTGQRERAPRPSTSGSATIQARESSFMHDVATVAGRSLRAVPRDSEMIIPPIFISVFFYIVNIGTLQDLTQAQAAGFDYKAFQMATAILLGVTGVSRAYALVLDIQNGYFDRLLMTPVSRLAILIGHMLADVAVACVLCVPILALGFSLGVRFEAGPLAVPVFVMIAGAWSLAFAGFGYALALKTGNPAAVNQSFLLFFPFLFLTSSYVPRNQLTGWLDTVATWNPVTYLLEGLRALVMRGWEWDELAKAAIAVTAVGVLSMWLCIAALRGRIKRGG